MSACSSPTPSEPSVASPTQASTPPEQTPTPSPTPVFDPTSVDPANFTYLGGCGYSGIAWPTTLAAGAQVEPFFRLSEILTETAQLTEATPITLAGQNYLLVRLTCAIGDTTTLGWHLIGGDERGAAVDLGLVAATEARDFTVTAGHDELEISGAYFTSADSNADATGQVSYRVAVVGHTPVQLFGGQSVADVPAEVAGWRPQQWAEGLVRIAITPDLALPGHSVPGVLTGPDRVLGNLTVAGDPCNYYDSSTTAGEVIMVDVVHSHPIPGNDAARGTMSGFLFRAAQATPTAVGSVPLPLTEPIDGLLIPGSGLVPALASAPADKAEWDGNWVVSALPNDDRRLMVNWLTREDHDAVGWLREPSGAVVMTGSWYHEQPRQDEPPRAMQPLYTGTEAGEPVLNCVL